MHGNKLFLELVPTLKSSPRLMSLQAHGEHLSFGVRPAERRGCIEVVCGSMFSGKTEELIRRRRRFSSAN